jgi:hypothetical protein
MAEKKEKKARREDAPDAYLEMDYEDRNGCGLED